MNVEQRIETAKRHARRWRAAAFGMTLLAILILTVRPSSSGVTGKSIGNHEHAGAHFVQIGPENVVNLNLVTGVYRYPADGRVWINVSGPPGSYIEFKREAGADTVWQRFQALAVERWELPVEKNVEKK